jgi:hypothetical protein
MGEAPDSDVQEVIDWWREYGFKRGDCEYADVNVLFWELLERLDALSIDGQMQVFSWIDENGY